MTKNPNMYEYVYDDIRYVFDAEWSAFVSWIFYILFPHVAKLINKQFGGITNGFS